MKEDNRRFRPILLLALLLPFIQGCQTSMKLQSNPDGAEVSLFAKPTEGGGWEMKDKLRTPQVYVLPTPEAFFGSESTTTSVLKFEKSGHESVWKRVQLLKNEENDIPTVTLPPLNTVVNVTTDPQGANISLHRNIDDAKSGANPVMIPEDDSVSVPVEEILQDISLEGRRNLVPSTTSPWILKTTRKFASENLRQVGWIRVEMEGFITEIKQFRITPGVRQSEEFKLRPAVVNLNITSNPPGAIVEDLRPGGFGKLGETEINLQITYDQIRNRPELLQENRLLLDLRGFYPGPGYTEWNRKDIAIPLGETYNLEFVLEPTLKQVHFTSAPAGASVYVIREKESQDREDEGRSTTEFKKHLGITPLNYNIDPGDPLVHGEKIYFELDGYKVADVNYAKGELIIHGKLEPLNPGER